MIVFVDFPGNRYSVSVVTVVPVVLVSRVRVREQHGFISLVTYGFADLSVEVETQGSLSYLTSSLGVLSFYPSGLGSACSP